MTDEGIEAEYWTRYYEQHPDDYANPDFADGVAVEDIDLSDYQAIVYEHYQQHG